jgi:hypothetical protein
VPGGWVPDDEVEGEIVKPYHTESIRIDVSYYRDGSYEFRMMKPDSRKRNQKGYAKKLKWERAIASGFGGNIRDWDEDIMHHAVYSGLPPMVSSLCAHMAHLKRCLLHDWEGGAGAKWIKKFKPLTPRPKL